jgi:hypothetical protein
MQPSVQRPISKDKNVMAQTRKYYLKKHYLTLRSKVKVPWRSLQYTTHRLMVMHPHTINLSQKTKMLWPGQENTISKTIIWPWGQRSRSHKGSWYVTHRLMVMHPHTKYHWPISKDKKVMVRTSFLKKWKKRKRKKKSD